MNGKGDSPNRDPWIRVVRTELKPPSLRDNTGDVDRVIKGIRKVLED